jgi:pyruvate/2-oxoglutarate dehydrogenase complex dihydrolipoamide acyltransferase (E2) component
MKSIALGIKEIPQINSLCDREGYTILEEVNINVAVELGEKLLVPVVRDVGKKSILKLIRDLDGLIKKAREDKLRPEDIMGGTVTLTRHVRDSFSNLNNLSTAGRHPIYGSCKGCTGCMGGEN